MTLESQSEADLCLRCMELAEQFEEEDGELRAVFRAEPLSLSLTRNVYDGDTYLALTLDGQTRPILQVALKNCQTFRLSPAGEPVEVEFVAASTLEQRATGTYRRSTSWRVTLHPTLSLSVVTTDEPASSAEQVIPTHPKPPPPTKLPSPATSALDHRLPPPVLAALLAAGVWLLTRLGVPVELPDTARLPLAALLALAGVACDLLGLFAFRRARTTINPLHPDRTSALVTGGIYRLTRNPMYVGLCLLLLAWGLYWGSAWFWLGPVLFVPYITRFQIQPEERLLAARFGDEFQHYAARVRRWV